MFFLEGGRRGEKWEQSVLWALGIIWVLAVVLHRRSRVQHLLDYSNQFGMPILWAYRFHGTLHLFRDLRMKR